MSVNNTSLLHTYPKTHRLLNSKQFKWVFDNVQFKVHTTYLLAFITYNDKQHARLGLAITKKKIAKAFARNRLKRHIKENFRLNKSLPCIDMVIIVKQSPHHLTNKQLNSEIQILLQKVDKKVSRIQ